MVYGQVVSAAMRDGAAAGADAGLTEHTRTRRALLQAANSVFSEQGWTAARVEDVARLAGVSATTAYNHFSSKYVLIGHTYAELMAPLLQQAERDRTTQRAWLPALTEHIQGLATVARDHRRLSAAFACAVQEFTAQVGARPDPSDESDPRVIVPVPQGLTGLIDAGQRNGELNRHREALDLAEQVTFTLFHRCFTHPDEAPQDTADVLLRIVDPPRDEPGSPDHDVLTAFRHAPAGVVVARPDGVITACNPPLADLLGREPADLLGTVLFEMVHPDDLEDAKHQCGLMLADGTRLLHHECRFRLANRDIWVAVGVSRVGGRGDQAEHVVIHIEDITERKQREARLSHQALHDPLTNLANRALLTQRIHDSLSRHGRHAWPSHLFYLDLDGFKAVNDRFGHDAGDAVLIELAERIGALLRPDDTAARLGGDEFVVLCEDTEPRHAAAIADRLRSAAAQPFHIAGATVTLSAAVGACPIHPADPSDPVDLLRQADERMYEIKRCRTPGQADGPGR